MNTNTQAPEPQDNGDGQTLDVHSIWDTIQGEGPWAGVPATFIRLAGCNLQCPFCFGISTKSTIPYVTKSYGPKTRLDKVQKGDVLLTFDDRMQMVETKVTNVICRQVDEWVELVAGDFLYEVTPEHPFFTTRGLVCAKDLDLGDDILEAREQEVVSFKKQGNRNPIHTPEVMQRKLLNTDYVAMGRSVSNTILQKKELGIYVPSFATLSEEQQEVARSRNSISKRRDKNPNWKGIQPNLLNVKEAIQNGTITTCENCGIDRVRLLIHHKDENHNNDDRSNLVVWCHPCHNAHHQRGFNFWNTERVDRKVIKEHNGRKVNKVRRCYGKLNVMNISCAPYNTFLANRMWVHNCDTEYTQGREWVDVDSIVSKVHKNLVVITGGEPFRQRLRPLLIKLQARGKTVQIETNGTMPIGDLVTPGDSMVSPIFRAGDIGIVCSPKTPSINKSIAPFIGAVKYILKAGKVADDGMPLNSLEYPTSGVPARPSQFPSLRPNQIYVQPLDEQDPEANHLNVQAAVKSCETFGFRLCLQLHKIVGLP